MADARVNSPLFALLAVSVTLFAVRLFAASNVGFGDSEALYACYALHPAPAYLDHPGLVGLMAGVIGHGGAPSPHDTHVVTAVLATLVPWLMVAAARASGAALRGACAAGLAMAFAPEIAVGLFAMTPDLLLALLWLGSLALACAALRAPSSAVSAASFVFAGLLAGIAIAAKISGMLLFAALALAYLSPSSRKHMKTPWPWAGLALGALVALPIFLFEARTGWPMLHHRLVDSQSSSGPSLRNIVSVIFGQLGYVSPLLAFFAVKVGVDLVRRRREDAVSFLLFLAFVVPLAPLTALCLWSRVAEPHWIAPALLALPIHYARTSVPWMSKRIARASLVLAGALVAAVHAWVLVPSLTRFAPRALDPKLDISNELYGWSEARGAIESMVEDEHDVVVVGPHWVICAQIHAALGRGTRVGCMTPIRDDFDVWQPRSEWKRAEKIIYVSDNRFEGDPAVLFPDRVVARRGRVTILRGGRIARVFSVAMLESRARASF